MTKKIYTLAALIIISLVLYVYLASEFYAVQYGTATGDSICSINDIFNCEAVAASKFSSLFGGIPNAILGLMLNFVMLISLFGILTTSDSKDKNWQNFFGGLASINLLASILMAGVAIFAMDVYCLFCMALYALSAVIFGLYVYMFKYKPSLTPLIGLLKSNVFIGLIVAIPALSLLSHKIIKNDYSPAAQEKEISSTIKQWKRKKPVDLNGPAPLFVLNPGAKIKIAEFADFLCPHCSTAASTLEGFLNTHPDVEFSFYAYPLDPNCNKNFESEAKGPGFSCTLAAGVYCAQKQGVGTNLHHDIFDNQNYYRKVAMSGNNEGLISQMESLLKQINRTQVDLVAWKTCLAEDVTNQALIDSAKLGKKVGVEGTPTVYMNSKKLSGGGHYLVLKAAHKELN
ncbi:MAG: vitamin K epoxide reductase family protein [Bdellovibrionales bacterium]